MTVPATPEATPIEPAADPSAPTATPPVTGERTFTQSELDGILHTRMERFKASHVTEKPKEKPTGRKPADPPAPAQATGKHFDRGLGRADLNSTQEGVLELLWERVPEGTDPAEWIPKQCAAMGWSKTPPTADPVVTATPDPIPDPPVNPSSNGGAPGASTKPYTETDNPLQWSKDQLASILADKGQRKGIAYIRARLEAHAETIQVRLR